jgi:hypothetical protein
VSQTELRPQNVKNCDQEAAERKLEPRQAARDLLASLVLLVVPGKPGGLEVDIAGASDRVEIAVFRQGG